MKPESKIKLDQAELFYKFSLGVRTLIDSHDKNKVLPHLAAFTYYRHVVYGDELKISRDEELKGASMLEHVATYIMMVQLDSVLDDEWGEGKIRHKDPNIEKQNISRVVSMIRNAFAHDPFNPTWNISDLTWKKEYKITDKMTMKDILTLNATDLDGKSLRRKREKEVKIDKKEDSKEKAIKIRKVPEFANDYGGQIALFRLLQYVRKCY